MYVLIKEGQFMHLQQPVKESRKYQLSRFSNLATCHFQIGQSLLEVVVLIGLALVIVTGLTVVTINGLKNTQFSQNQAQATRFAQDAVDCVRSIKDTNKPITIGGSPYYWYDASSTKSV